MFNFPCRAELSGALQRLGKKFDSEENGSSSSIIPESSYQSFPVSQVIPPQILSENDNSCDEEHFQNGDQEFFDDF
ncbi:unnamed protein product [Oikopleura dioica]|uniref:Uncharacterized protein n=1 Tax=Oikopleura dioica TaxID=34765 RepID=E4Y5L5_OIKDI|nr:unnamed protein product [Oikopleura dioica]